LRPCNTEKVIGFVVAKNKRQALLKALLKDEDIRNQLNQYFWETIEAN